MQPAGSSSGDAHVPVNTDRIVGGSKLLSEMRDLIRRKHSSIRTEQAYLEWAKRYILFHGKRHPKEMGEQEIVAFLSDLAVKRNVAAATQNQALNALVFLDKQVLGREELTLDGITRAKRPERLPRVLDRGEIERMFVHLEATPKLVAALLDGAGLRLLEALRLRIQDLEFERSQIVVRNGKGAKDRVTLLPAGLLQPIRDQMASAPRCGKTRRHHIGESAIQRAVKKALSAAAIHKHGSCRTLRPQLRHPSTGRRLRHPHRSRAARAQRCPYHDDRHASDEQGAAGRQASPIAAYRLLNDLRTEPAMTTKATLKPGQKGTKRLADS